MKSTLLLFLLLSLSLTLLVRTDDILLKPIKSSSVEAALIIIQGASISEQAYRPLAQSVQNASSIKLWVAIPGYLLDIAPIGLKKGILRVLDSLRQSGMPPTTPVFVAGHSLGAAVLQDLVASDPSLSPSSSPPIVGQILMGAVLLRKHRNSTNPYPVPTLALNGELDGMMRASRVAEEYWYRVVVGSDGDGTTRFPVVLVPGVTHMQFASGDVPFAVRKKDLRPEVSYDQAHSSIASVVASFLSVVLSSPLDGPASLDSLRNDLLATHRYVRPLIDALQLDGHYHLLPPCDSDHPSPQCPFYPAWPLQPSRSPSNNTQCSCGCGWVEQVAQRLIAGLPSSSSSDSDPSSPLLSLVVVDAPHDVTDTKPYHHAHLWSNCSDDYSANRPCTLNLTTVSQLVYDFGDDYDTGFTHCAASEIRVKMKSRQAIWRSSIKPSASLDEDKPSFCAQINQQAYDWALSNADPSVIARFKRVGQPMVMGDDITLVVQAGPLWIWNPLRYETKTVEGRTVLEVRSPTMKTDVTAWIYPDSDGYHYCKLLSPARAMEWIYTDGIRLNGGLQ